MPYVFMILGPHQIIGNALRSIEHAVGLVCELLQYGKDHDYTYVAPTGSAVERWTEHVFECSKGALSNEIDSWMTGVNRNVKGRTVRTVVRYAGPAATFRSNCEDWMKNGWKGQQFARLNGVVVSACRSVTGPGRPALHDGVQ